MISLIPRSRFRPQVHVTRANRLADVIPLPRRRGNRPAGSPAHRVPGRQRPGAAEPATGAYVAQCWLTILVVLLGWIALEVWR